MKSITLKEKLAHRESLREKTEQQHKYRVKAFMPIELEDDLPFNETLDEAISEIENEIEMMSENVYRIIEYDMNGEETGKVYSPFKTEDKEYYKLKEN